MKNRPVSSKLARFCQLWQVLLPLGACGTLWAQKLGPNGAQAWFFSGLFLTAAAGALAAECLVPRESGDSEPGPAAKYVLLALVVFAAALRFAHTDFGFPNFNHPDEGPKGRIVARMISTGSLNPHYFLHPSLLLYLSAALSWVLSFLEPARDAVERSVFAGRLVSAAAGTASVALTYLLGRRLLSWRAGLTAAALLAFSPLHVTCSRYMKEDVLCLALILAALTSAAKACAEKRPGWFLLAGFLCGCAAGAKYTGILTVVLFAVLAALYRADRIFSKRVLLAALVLAPLGFLACTPYSLLDSSSFIKNFLTERAHMRSGHHGVAISAASQWWMYHWSRSILPGAGLLPALLGAAGVGLIIRRRAVPAAIVIVALLAFYLPAEWVKAKPPPQPERYILGCLPFLALAAAELLDRLHSSGRVQLARALCFFAVVFPAWRTLELAGDLSVDTRQAMRNWMVANLDPHSKILIEASYSPRLTETTFDRKLVKASKHPQRITRSRLEESGYEYLLVNSFSYDRYFTEPEYDEVLRRRFENIFERYPLVMEFSAPSGSYGFQNPVVRLYRITKQE